MGNVSELTKEARRLKVRQLLLLQPSSNRNWSAVARQAGCDVGTVKKDVAYLRRRARANTKHLKLDDRKIEIDEQYLFEIERCEINIQQAQASEAWSAIASLRKARADLIYKRAELWGLIAKGGVNVNVNNEIKNHVEAKANVYSGFSESDLRELITLAKKINTADSTPSENRIGEKKLQ